MGRRLYPPVVHVMGRTMRSYVRDAVLGTVMVVTLAPWHAAMAQNKFSDRMVFVLVTSLVHTVMFIVAALPFVLCDQWGWLQQYKLPRKTSTSLLHWALAKEMVSNHIVTSPLAALIAYPMFRYFGMPNIVEAPDLDIVHLVRTFLIAHFLNDVGFYVTHRILHTKYFYSFHKKHHAFHATIAPAAEYSDFLESVFSNTLPTIAGCLFFGRHPLIFWVWLALRLHQTYEVHSGFAFLHTWADFFLLTHARDTIEHDHHHTVNKGNFGSLWLDYLGGTMDSFLTDGAYDAYLLASSSRLLRVIN